MCRTGDKDKANKCVFVSLFSLFIESISNVVKTLLVLLSRERARVRQLEM